MADMKQRFVVEKGFLHERGLNQSLPLSKHFAQNDARPHEPGKRLRFCQPWPVSQITSGPSLAISADIGTAKVRKRMRILCLSAIEGMVRDIVLGLGRN